MVGYPPCRSDMSGSFPVVDKHRFRICRSSLRQERRTTTSARNGAR
jgi:hypothetical protein